MTVIIIADFLRLILKNIVNITLAISMPKPYKPLKLASPSKNDQDAAFLALLNEVKPNRIIRGIIFYILLETIVERTIIFYNPLICLKILQFL